MGHRKRVAQNLDKIVNKGRCEGSFGVALTRYFYLINDDPSKMPIFFGHKSRKFWTVWKILQFSVFGSLQMTETFMGALKSHGNFEITMIRWLCGYFLVGK